ncbi:MAG: histidine phosphatase family protein [Nanoarchaeota archaeon]|nr:histidine phosphatase family protein [Nanoarchaeota archaeon]MBU1631974.1 histidine phosphatase family protein [Nanoarchaeota archaeon]MBU1876084.1 histidine phosphatase family protein [Nanoarchaeota archaeon]
MFFTSLVNVEEHLNRVGTLIRRNEINLIGHEVKIICNYIALVTGRHESTYPNTVAKLQKVKDKLNKLKSYSAEKLKNNFSIIKKEFEDIYTLTPVYLMRHPEKATEKTRQLSFHGVRQAKGVAEYLAEEALLCPKPVHIYLFCSDLRRTYLFAKVIQRKFNQLMHFYDKEVKIEAITEHPALYVRFTKEALNETIEEYKKSEFHAFSSWMAGKYKLSPDPKKVIEEVAAWVRDEKAKSNAGEWTIVVGISHSFIIDALLFSVTREHESIIPTAGFAKFIGNKMFYENKWYNFS